MSAAIIIAALAGSVVSTLVTVGLLLWVTRSRVAEAKKQGDETVVLMRERNELDKQKVEMVAKLCDEISTLRFEIKNK